MVELIPEVVRHPHLIPDDLRAAIRSLVNGESPWPLLAYGGAGTGKSCAMLSLTDYAGGCYWTVGDLCETIIAAQQGRLMTTGSNGCEYESFESDVWSRISRQRFAVLDEIGSRAMVSDHHYNCVKKFLDMRTGKPAAYLSNLNPSELVRLYDDRIASRLASGTVLEITGPDRRIIRP